MNGNGIAISDADYFSGDCVVCVGCNGKGEDDQDDKNAGWTGHLDVLARPVMKNMVVHKNWNAWLWYFK